MKKHLALTGVILLALGAISCSRHATAHLMLGKDFEGDSVTIATFHDTVPLEKGVVKDGEVTLDLSDDLGDKPSLVQIMIGGRSRGFFVLESGRIEIDSVRNPSGTPLNDRFTKLSIKADSVAETDDMDLYRKILTDFYKENKDNAIGEYFGVELVRNSELHDIDLMLAGASDELKKSTRLANYRNAALLRENTSPGRKFVDFGAVQPDGSTMKLSDIAGRGQYTLVDFWASWCPYCVRDLSSLKEIYEEFSPKGLKMVGVAVRDQIDATDQAVKKYDIPYQILYNAGRIPYDLYGFTGIPYYMLISPDGTIVSRGETPAALRQRLNKIYL